VRGEVDAVRQLVTLHPQLGPRQRGEDQRLRAVGGDHVAVGQLVQPGARPLDQRGLARPPQGLRRGHVALEQHRQRGGRAVQAGPQLHAAVVGHRALDLQPALGAGLPRVEGVGGAGERGEGGGRLMEHVHAGERGEPAVARAIDAQLGPVPPQQRRLRRLAERSQNQRARQLAHLGAAVGLVVAVIAEAVFVELLEPDCPRVPHVEREAAGGAGRAEAHRVERAVLSPRQLQRQLGVGHQRAFFVVPRLRFAHRYGP
jgi:hypothetical protein